jgi:hypothetical protein
MSFIDDLVGNFTGSKSKADLARGKAQSDADLSTGYNTGRSDLGAASDRFNSFAQGGQAANTRYLDTLGINGADAQKTAEGAYFNDPVQNSLMDRITKANTRAYTARGMNNSGAATQSLTNSLLDNYRQYQSQLAGAGSQGLAATGSQANLGAQQGQMAYGYGATQAGNDINFAKSQSEAENTGINNLFKIGQIAASAYGGRGGGGGGGGRAS